jgi:hypothetical protein
LSEKLIIIIGLGLWYLTPYMIEFVSDLRQVNGFLWVLLFPPPIKLIAMIKVKYLGQQSIVKNAYEKINIKQRLILVLIRLKAGTVICQKYSEIFFHDF